MDFEISSNGNKFEFKKSSTDKKVDFELSLNNEKFLR